MSETPKDPHQHTDDKTMKQTNEPWKQPVEKEQDPGNLSPEDLERWQKTIRPEKGRPMTSKPSYGGSGKPRLSEHDIQRKQLGPRGVPGQARPGQNDAAARKENAEKH
jgi:hypothetical protein